VRHGRGQSAGMVASRHCCLTGSHNERRHDRICPGFCPGYLPGPHDIDLIAIFGSSPGPRLDAERGSNTDAGTQPLPQAQTSTVT